MIVDVNFLAASFPRGYIQYAAFFRRKWWSVVLRFTTNLPAMQHITLLNFLFRIQHLYLGWATTKTEDSVRHDHK